MKPLFLFLGLGLVVFALVCAANARGARKALAAQTTETLALSNQLAQAKAQLDEKDAAIQTLRVQQGLLSGDLTSLSNRLQTLSGLLAREQEQTAAARQAVARGEAGLRSLQAQLEDARDRIKTLEQQSEQLQREVEIKQSQLEAGHAAREALRQRLNASESTHAALLQKWNDPAALRAQAARLTREMTPLAGAAAPRQRPPLVLAPDGSITTAR
ncbi:MAG TPA: hypothetical protein PKX23_03265 [Verrucomicrobiota bacterium]|jgi:chromosome segregation ATPase|nr:hypothetical protein [Verrucomicrobiota bacterium]HRT06758.1 hypothetical protein [Candidatus Paceibacterota bacterium]HRT56812.1 hypothetical protein [Candidatus Paceibacterota bacterium]